MLKLAGAVMIMIATSVWGFSKSDKLKKRVGLTSKLISGLVLLENEISYGKRDIKNVLESIGKAEGIKLFEEAAGHVDKLGIKKAFLAAEENCGQLFLGTEKQAIETLAESLGMTDTTTQIKCIRHAKVLFEEANKSAVAEYEKSGKMYRSAGILGGLSVVIFLL